MQVFLECYSGIGYFAGDRFADVAVMPRLIDYTGYFAAAVRVAQDEAVIGAVLHEPFLSSGALLPLVKICIEIVYQIDRKAELMLTRAGYCD